MPPAYKGRPGQESSTDTARLGRCAVFLNNFTIGKKRKKILNGLQKSRNKFSPSSKTEPDNVNIYLGLKCNFEKNHFFPNSNKIATKFRIKILFDFDIKSLIFLYFEEVILSSLFYF